MNGSSKIGFFVLALLLTTLVGCRQRIGDFTILSSQNVNFGAITADIMQDAEEFEGADIRAFGVPNLEEALDEALRKGQGNVMVDAALYYYQAPFVHGYIVKGKVIRAR